MTVPCGGVEIDVSSVTSVGQFRDTYQLDG